MYRFMVSCETDDEDQARIVKKFMDSLGVLPITRFCETVPGQPKPINEYLIESQELIKYETRVDATSHDEAIEKWKRGECDEFREVEASLPVITRVRNLTKEK